MPRDPTLALLTALAGGPRSTADLARLVRGRRSPANAAYCLLRVLEGIGVVERCGAPEGVARGRGRPAAWWRLCAACARGRHVEELEFPIRIHTEAA